MLVPARVLVADHSTGALTQLFKKYVGCFMSDLTKQREADTQRWTPLSTVYVSEIINCRLLCQTGWLKRTSFTLKLCSHQRRKQLSGDGSVKDLCRSVNQHEERWSTASIPYNHVFLSGFFVEGLKKNFVVGSICVSISASVILVHTLTKEAEDAKK